VAALRALLEKQLAAIPQQSYSILLFDEVPELKGIEWLEPLFEAIRSKTSLMINYRPFEAETAMEKHIHPWWLKQSNQRWFLFGWDEEANRLDNSPLDRIESIKTDKLAYRENDYLDPITYFENVIGVTRKENEQPQKIFLKIYGKQASYTDTKKLHASQVVEKIENDFKIFSIKAIINYELISKLLSLGADVEVISPESLRIQMREIWERGLMHYLN